MKSFQDLQFCTYRPFATGHPLFCFYDFANVLHACLFSTERTLGTRETCPTISKMAYVPSHLAKGITHQQRVMRLYRNSLRHLLDWVIDRQSWRQEAVKLRERFDAHKHEKDRRKIHKIMEAAEREFEKYKHPFPYVRKYSYFFPFHYQV